MSQFHNNPFNNNNNNDNFFHHTTNDVNYNNEEDFGGVTKFESFMQRSTSTNHSHQQQYNTNRHHQRQFNNSNNNNPISPRSESDGMSYVSRMKHNNYANVVMEMKKKQTYSSSDEPQYYDNDNVGREI